MSEPRITSGAPSIATQESSMRRNDLFYKMEAGPNKARGKWAESRSKQNDCPSCNLPPYPYPQITANSKTRTETIFSNNYVPLADTGFEIINEHRDPKLKMLKELILEMNPGMKKDEHGDPVFEPGRKYNIPTLGDYSGRLAVSRRAEPGPSAGASSVILGSDPRLNNPQYYHSDYSIEKDDK